MGGKVPGVEVVYVTHPSFHRHDTGAWHPERAGRLEAVERGVLSSGIHARRIDPPEVDLEVLTRVHEPTYVDAIRRFCAAGGGALDPDTVASSQSWEAALRAAGAGPAAVAELRRAASGTGAFLAVRPPGHHALANRAMGFCLFNNVVVTAADLVAGGEKVAILDWDVHHGNGTQSMVADDPDILYVSIHQHPFYPFVGELDEEGEGEGLGTVVNCPVPAGTGGDVYRQLFERVVIPVLTQFEPSWVLLSAGYDAHEEDPLAELRLLSDDYGWMAGRLRQVVDPNRVVVFLEGGYHLPALTTSVAATLQGLSGRDFESTTPRTSPPVAWSRVDEVVDGASRYWKVR